MKITDLNGKKVCILGFGKEGRAMLRILKKHAPDADITIADANPIERKMKNEKLITGPDYLKDLDQFDIIIKSPGVPPHPELAALGATLTSGTQIFLDTIADSGAMVIGVTGSKGKSTTSTLIYEELKAAGRDAHLIGNIGKPAIEYIDLAKSGTVFVMEMSSYQLMDLTHSPQIAVVTSFFPEHLDYHGSLEAYLEAKKHIARFQHKDDVMFYNGMSEGARAIASESAGESIPFTTEDAPLPLSETKLLGLHNLSNIAAAFKVAIHLGIPQETCVQVFRRFEGLPHRLQSLGIHHGIEWVDDAISTTPESTIAALDALGDRVTTIILGGQDRGNDFAKLGERIVDSEVRTVMLFPGSGGRIRAAIEGGGGSAPSLRPSPSAFGLGEGRGKMTIHKGISGLRSPHRTIVTHAREMRKKPTDAEGKLWEILRGNQLEGFYFRRQYPFKSFILDFYCDAAHLGIEIDGSVHDENATKEYDHERSLIFEDYGIRVIRFSNDDVIHNQRMVIDKILQELKRSSPLPGRDPEGRGRGGGAGGGGMISFHNVTDMRTAVATAKQHTPPGTICLLSTASPSYNMFKNFEEKGDAFRQCVLESR
ncbi:MAG: UDP-N-acetylmuramoylalanine--D-glutamate ligase [Candidatus Peregrinibacteria bacterium Greene0416_19]|nr:MAG: UDP-N-acetylmuramoylalanine--D-glutamate ligase [Candidatus Peregrinibacteria bacterium Greene0416_19]